MRVLVADRSAERRQAITEALHDVRVVASVPDLHSATHAMYGDTPELVVAGSDLADGGVLELLYLSRRAPKPPVAIVVDDDITRDMWCRFVTAGAHRCIKLRETASAVELLARRGPRYSDDLALLDRIATTTMGSRPAMRWLALALILRSRRRANTQPIQLAQLAQDVLDIIANAVGSTVTVTTDLAPRRVLGVRGELEQLVASLVLNALDAMPTGGVLHLAVHSNPGSAVLEVAGDGEFPPDWLGLSLARRIVEHHKGDLRVVPLNGHGVVTRVVLPAGL